MCNIALGRELYRLGYCYFMYGETISGFGVYRRALVLLPETDIYHAALVSAIESENERSLGYIFGGSGGIMLQKCGSKLKLCKMIGYDYEENFGNENQESGKAVNNTFDIMLAAAFCDRTLFDSEIKPGEKYMGSETDVTDNKKCMITYQSEKETVETSCGSFENCDLWVTKRYG